MTTLSVSLLLNFIQLPNTTEKSKNKQNASLWAAYFDCISKRCVRPPEGRNGEASEHCLLSSMFSWGPVCLRVWTVTCETRKKQDIAPLCLLKNTQWMDCHYKTNPSPCIPPVHQTLPVEQDMTQSGKGGMTCNLFQGCQLSDLYMWPKEMACTHKFRWSQTSAY